MLNIGCFFSLDGVKISSRSGVVSLSSRQKNHRDILSQLPQGGVVSFMVYRHRVGEECEKYSLLIF